MKILIVEDNEINAKLLEIMLNELEFEVTTTVASDAKEALEESAAQQYDLVLMDINLGDGLMDGTEAMRILKEREQYSQVPIYAITCYSLPGDKEKFLEQGFDKYFSKPIAQAPLLSSIEEENLSSK